MQKGITQVLRENELLGTPTTATSGRSPEFRKGSNPNPAEFVEDLLRTPAASEAERGHQPEDKSRARGGQVTLSGQMMTYFPTPNTMDMLPARTPEQKAANKGKGGYANVRETVVNELMPTPKARDSQAEGYEAGLRRSQPQVGTLVKALVDGDSRVMFPTPIASEGTKASAAQSSKRRLETGQVFLTNIIHDVAVENGMPVPQGNLLPTTRTSMANGPSQKELDAGNPKFRLETVTNWGKFEPAIRRWEKTLGRSAPSPTKSDGKDGAHRLSSKFTEWMMGLPSGWITEVGLSRNDELKACGNGVVPQQAELALRALLEGVTIPAGGGQVNLPTPTVSDTFTDNLSSTQQKEGSMHSVTLPQAVRMVKGEGE